MMTFRKGLGGFKLPMSTVWLMSDIAEAKGRQELYTKQAPQVLKALREVAMVESVESSNRIEGVTVAPDRLRPLVLGNTLAKGSLGGGNPDGSPSPPGVIAGRQNRMPRHGKHGQMGSHYLKSTH
jgi:hypothetical protein